MEKIAQICNHCGKMMKVAGVEPKEEMKEEATFPNKETGDRVQKEFFTRCLRMKCGKCQEVTYVD